MAEATSRAFCDLDTWFFFPKNYRKWKLLRKCGESKPEPSYPPVTSPSQFFFESLILLFKAHCVVWLINRFCGEQRSPCMYERVFRTRALPCQGHQCLRPKGTARSFPVQSSDTVCGKYQPLNQGFLLHGNWPLRLLPWRSPAKISYPDSSSRCAWKSTEFPGCWCFSIIRAQGSCTHVSSFFTPSLPPGHSLSHAVSYLPKSKVNPLWVRITFHPFLN